MEEISDDYPFVNMLMQQNEPNYIENSGNLMDYSQEMSNCKRISKNM